mgnify:CR=1 FL=1
MLTKIFLTFVSAFIILFIPQATFALDPPQLSSPSDGSTISSVKLEWNQPSYQVCSANNSYRIQVDDNPSFSPSSEIDKKTYTKNTNYSPQLTEGAWYWRVMARDESCSAWSSWSNVWTFTFSNAAIPSPSPSNEQQDSNSSPSPTSQSSFMISGLPPEITSDQTLSVKIDLKLPNNPNSKFYLKGAFKKSDGSNYFGLTKVSGSWVKNGSSYSSQYPITTDAIGAWSGNLEIKVDDEDSGFSGTGDYIFKVGRYSTSGSGPNWSNELNLKINGAVSSSSQGGLTKSKNNPSTINSSSKTNSLTYLTPKSSNNIEYQTASVAGIESSPESSPSVEALSKKINFIPWLGFGLIICGFLSIGLIYLKSSGRYEKLLNKIRGRNKEFSL